VENIILTVHLILALCLIGVVLIQRSEGGGLGMGGGGGGGAMSGRQAATALTKLTWGFAIAFIATSVTLTVLAARDAATSSVIDTISAPAPVQSDGVTPALPSASDLLPPPLPVQEDPSRLTPPRAD
jgi:preprotein translocase subunit SecG